MKEVMLAVENQSPESLQSSSHRSDSVNSSRSRTDMNGLTLELVERPLRLKQMPKCALCISTTHKGCEKVSVSNELGASLFDIVLCKSVDKYHSK